MHNQTGIPDRIHSDLEEILKCWRFKKEARDIPARRSINSQDIPHLLRGICILEINYDGEDIERIKFCLAGTKLSEMAGKELTGATSMRSFRPIFTLEPTFNGLLKIVNLAFAGFNGDTARCLKSPTKW